MEDFLAKAVDAAKIAGEVIKHGFYQTKHVEHKGEVDLVTETDKKCEDLIFDYLKQHFPEHKFVGEETTAACGATELTEEPTWVVDPLDGTTNFVHGFPFVCVSIGLTIGRIPTVGVVYNPIMDELFTAVRGKGAFLNGKAIKVSSQTELVKALLVTEVGTKRDKATVDETTNRINSLLFKVRSLRMCGSCALNLCGIACGRLDLFYELGFGGPWDVAAGAVIVTEAGGLVFDPSGKDFDITSQRVAASNPLLKDAFIETLKQSERGGANQNPENSDKNNIFCVRHLHNSMKRDGFKSVAVKLAFWAAAKATRVEEFRLRMAQMKETDENAYEWLAKKSENQWSKAFFSTYPKCDTY